MHVVKQVVQQSSGFGRPFIIGSGRNRNPQKSKIRPELSSGQWNEYNWNTTSGGKFEAFRSQSFHAKLNTAKTKHF